MAEEMKVRLGYNEGPPSVEIGGSYRVMLVRGEKSAPVPLSVAANVLAFPRRTFRPLVFPETQGGKLDKAKLAAAVEKAKLDRDELRKFQQLGIDIKHEDWKMAYSPRHSAAALARALSRPVEQVRAFARMNKYELAPDPSLDDGFSVEDLTKPEPGPRVESKKPGGDK
jgi:hypothetical protein